MPMPLTVAEALDGQESAAAAKAALAKGGLPRYLVLAMLAGAYVGIAIALLLATAAAFIDTKNPGANLVKGSVFGIALTLVVFAGAELFTGAVPTMLQGLVARRSSVLDLAVVWVASWIGNLAGSLAFAAMVNASGVFTSGPVDPATHKTLYFTALATIIKGKVALTGGQLFWRAVLCNFLVCLGLWMASRANSDGAKLVVLWWALLAFIATGFEHSVANMTVFGLAIFAHVPLATAGAMTTNLLWVTLGNVVGGGLLVGLAYSYAGREKPTAVTVTLPETPTAAELDDAYIFEDEYVFDDVEPVAATVVATKTRARAASSKPAPRATATRSGATRATTATRSSRTGATTSSRTPATGTRRTTTPPPRTRATSTRGR
jgi:nitrite transporter NirC